jgi:hypothetical protein
MDMIQDVATLRLWGTVIYVVLSLGSWLFALIVIIKLLGRTVGLWGRGGGLFGTDPRQRLISLGVAALAFSNVVRALAGALLNFVTQLLVGAPHELFSRWQAAINFCNLPAGSAGCTSGPNSTCGDPLACLGSLSFGFTDAWARTLDNAFSGFDPASFPYRDLVLMLAVWAVAALFLGGPQVAEAGDAAQRKTWLQNLLGGLSHATRLNIVFFAILVVAGYLSIAAIVAIPGLQETAAAPAEVNTERLKQNLDDALGQMQVRLTPAISFTAPFAGAEANTPDLTRQQAARQQLLDMYAKLIKDALAQADNDRSAAVTTYDVAAVGRKGSQETVQHFQAIEAWFRSRLNALEAQIGDCRLSIQRADDAARFLASLPPTDVASTETGAFQVADVLWASQQSTARTTCQLSLRATPPPERPDLGSNLGPFSYVASWLLRTESLPLAQIVGMLGFGLLGSAVSSFVRQGTRRQPDGELVKDLPTLIIRGATAAVVVFLAVKGGLAIFASGTGEPNSYVLLLTCLVAAAFSEDVWKAARVWLRKQTGEKDKDKGEDKDKDEGK